VRSLFISLKEAYLSQDESWDVGVDIKPGFEDLTDTGLDLGVLACMGLDLKELAYMGPDLKETVEFCPYSKDKDGDLTQESSTSEKSSGESERERLSKECPNSGSSQDPITNMFEEDNISSDGTFGCDTSTDNIFTVDVIVAY